MNKYKVKIKNSKTAKIIKADSELEARVKFCRERDLTYRAFANKLDVRQVSTK